LDTSLDESVTVVEWGEGRAEALSTDRLEVVLHRPQADEEGQTRQVDVRGVGGRWRDVVLDDL
ncbi:MAG: tRNA threonylcarbamoyladenosine biosynthesis protein TsaE, partial [Actinomycetota bacterium]|nr:tRNA threonylcarbamoyladenosine biosynthesis protein TsaE [Actinomycetota bacterium]